MTDERRNEQTVPGEDGLVEAAPAGAAGDPHIEPDGAAPPKPEADPAEMLRRMFLNPRAFFDTSVPPLVFVILNAMSSLRVAAVAAFLSGTAISLYRLARRHEVRQALTGLFGLAIAVVIALATGNASNYFAPGVYMGVIIGVLMIVTVLLKEPASTLIARAIERKPPEYYAEPSVRNSHAVITLVWAAITLGKAAYKYVLLREGETAELGIVTILTGWPVTVAFVLASIAFLRWRGHAGPASRTD